MRPVAHRAPDESPRSHLPRGSPQAHCQTRRTCAHCVPRPWVGRLRAGAGGCCHDQSCTRSSFAPQTFARASHSDGATCAAVPRTRGRGARGSGGDRGQRECARITLMVACAGGGERGEARVKGLGKHKPKKGRRRPKRKVRVAVAPAWQSNDEQRNRLGCCNRCTSDFAPPCRPGLLHRLRLGRGVGRLA